MSLRLVTLGSVRCFREGSEVAHLVRQPLRCAVLVHLGVEGEVTRESLTTLLWPERDPDRARHALNQKLYQLRRDMGDEWLESQTERMRVTSALRVDVHEFERAVERDELEEAMELYGGRFLADFHVPGSAGFDHWADRQRFRLVRLHRKARRTFIDRRVADGDVDRAIAHARRWVELEPMEDEAHHRLIELLAESGDRSDAIRQYESYQRMLAQEELTPLEQTVELIERVRGGARQPESPGTARKPASREGGSEREAPKEVDPAPTGAEDDAREVDAAPPFTSPGRRIAIGDSLNVALVLEGSVRQEDGGLRVAAQLIDVENDSHLVSRTFDREVGRMLALQEELAASIVEALRVRVPGLARERPSLGGTNDSRAYERFLRGRYQRQKGTRGAVREAVQHLDSAVTLDPDYALAHAELAQAYVRAAERGDLPRAETLETARSAANRAIALAPSLAAGHAALARVERDLWNWSAAERSVRRAIELQPGNASAHASYSGVLLVSGRVEEAVDEAARAAELEPLSAAALKSYAEALRAAGRYEEAVRTHRRSLELEPTLRRQSLAKTYIEMGRYDAALAEFNAAADAGAPRFPAVQLLWAAYTHAGAGNGERARALLRRFESRQPRRSGEYRVAATHMALGDRDRAPSHLETHVGETRRRAWRQLPWDPVWDPVRDDPRFARILERMNLPVGPAAP